MKCNFAVFQIGVGFKLYCKYYMIKFICIYIFFYLDGKFSLEETRNTKCATKQIIHTINLRLLDFVCKNLYSVYAFVIKYLFHLL